MRAAAATQSAACSAASCSGRGLAVLHNHRYTHCSPVGGQRGGWTGGGGGGSGGVQVRTHAVLGFGKKGISTAPREAPIVDKLEWQKPLQIVKYPDPRLRAVNARINCFDDSLVQLAKEMTEIMYQDDGVGLAAPQVGVNVRLMIFNPYGRDRPGHERILANPELVSSSKLKATDDEGCLSFPGILGEIERPRDVVVKAQNEKGEPVTLNLGGAGREDEWVSRIFQHEYDHLQGVLFHDRMRPAVLEAVRSLLVGLEESFIAEHPNTRVQRIPPPKGSKGFGFGAVKK